MKEEELKQIDDYFQMQLSDIERTAFEKRINENQEFADLVAFYSHTKAIEREKILQTRHKEWTNENDNKKPFFSPKIVTGLAASLLLFASIWYFGKADKKNYEEIATNYLQTELATLPVKMDAAEDSLEIGKKLYNEKKYEEAIVIFEKLNKPESAELLGLSYLQSGDYIKATTIFEKLSQNQELLNNKAKFYLALTYLKKGETAKGEAIMKEVIDGNLAGKVEAEKILE